MAEFTIRVSETQQRDIDVTADTLEDAIAQVQDSWNNGEIDLDDYRDFIIDIAPAESQAL